MSKIITIAGTAVLAAVTGVLGSASLLPNLRTSSASGIRQLRRHFAMQDFGRKPVHE